MEIRTLSAEDFETYRHIASRAFWRGEPVEMKPEEFLTEDRVRLGAFENGRLQAQYTIRDFELIFGETRRPCGGIAGVASEPSARGRGHAGALIDRSLEMMRDRGQYLSLLWPFDQRFYRKYGWDWVGFERSYTVPLQILETDPEAEYIEPVHSDFFAILNPIYEEKARGYNGALTRSEKRWNDLLEPYGQRHPATYVYARDGRAEGFAVIRYEKKEDRARANQFVALTPRAYRAFLTLFKRHAATVEKFVWSAPMDDSLWSHMLRWDLKTVMVPSAMGRIVDVCAALQSLAPVPDVLGTIALHLTDANAPWNDGTWRVEIEAGQVQVDSPGAGTAPDITLDIQALSQAYWGTPSLPELRRAGRLEVANEVAYGLLCRLLPPTPVWLADDF